MNKAVANELVHPKDASVPELGRFSYILKKLGLVLDADCPFKNSFDGEYIRTGGPVEKIDCMKVYEVGDDVPNSMAATDIITRLLIAPIACSVMLYPSYENSLREDKIYGPTDEEVETYEDDSSGLDCHTMLCTGHGVDRRGKEFLELQDSSGDVNAVDQGYVRFAHHNTVADYVYLEDFCPPAKKQKTH